MDIQELQNELLRLSYDRIFSDPEMARIRRAAESTIIYDLRYAKDKFTKIAYDRRHCIND